MIKYEELLELLEFWMVWASQPVAGPCWVIGLHPSILEFSTHEGQRWQIGTHIFCPDEEAVD